jgi:hypothetical protein
LSGASGQEESTSFSEEKEAKRLLLVWDHAHGTIARRTMNKKLLDFIAKLVESPVGSKQALLF